LGDDVGEHGQTGARSHWRNIELSRWCAFGDERDTSRRQTRFRGLGHEAAVGGDDQDVEQDAQRGQTKRGTRWLLQKGVAKADDDEHDQARDPDPRPKGHCPGLLIDGRVVQDQLDADRSDRQGPPVDAHPLQAGG